MEAHTEKLVMYWLNSLDVQSCLLVSALSDLQSGRVLCDVIDYIINSALGSGQHNDQGGWNGMDDLVTLEQFTSSLEKFRECFGPLGLLESNSSSSVASVVMKGHRPTTLALVSLLKACAEGKPPPNPSYPRSAHNTTREPNSYGFSSHHRTPQAREGTVSPQRVSPPTSGGVGEGAQHNGDYPTPSFHYNGPNDRTGESNAISQRTRPGSAKRTRTPQTSSKAANKGNWQSDVIALFQHPLAVRMARPSRPIRRIRHAANRSSSNGPARPRSASATHSRGHSREGSPTQQALATSVYRMSGNPEADGWEGDEGGGRASSRGRKRPGTSPAGPTGANNSAFRSSASPGSRRGGSLGPSSGNDGSMMGTPKARKPHHQFRHPSPSAPLRTLGFVSMAASGKGSGLFSQSHSSVGALNQSQGIRATSGGGSGEGGDYGGKRDTMREGKSSRIAAANDHSVSRPTTEAEDLSQHEAPLSAEQTEILDWLAMVGITVPTTQQLMGRPSTNIVHAFKNGVLLCDLMSALTRQKLNGMTRKPKSAASCIANLNRGLSLLRESPRMNPEFLWSAEEIYSGDAHVIWGLLGDIKKEYKIPSHLQNRAKKTRNQQQSSMTSLGDVTNIPSKDGSSGGRRGVGIEWKEPHRNLENVKKVSKESKAEVNTWLQRLKLPSMMSPNAQPPKNPVEDPRRNGTMLYELLQVLEQDASVTEFTKNPKVLSAAIGNTQKVMNAFRERKQIPVLYFREAEQVVKGNSDVLYGILLHVMNAYPDAGVSYTLPMDALLPYPPESIKKLETSLLIWVYSLGLLGRAEMPNDFDEIIPHVTNGILLCDLCSIMEGKKVLGVFRSPRTPGTCLANIAKAMDVLRARRGMGRRFLWKEAEVFRGRKPVILGLLEDMHRSHDGLPPRPDEPGAGESPYIGLVHTTGKHGEVEMPTMIAKTNHDPNRLLKEYAKGIKGTYGSQSGSNANSKNAWGGGSGGGSAKGGGRGSNGPAGAGGANDEASTPGRVDEEMVAALLGDKQYYAPPTELNPLAPSLARLATPTHSNIHPETFGTVDSGTELLPAPSFRPGYDGIPGEQGQEQPSQAYLLARWLQSLGLKLRSSFSLEGPVIDEFRDGLLLCELVGKLEHRDIEGVTKNPKATASYLYNINKALEVLKLKKTMPMDHLWSDEEIMKGNPEVICSLLEQMRTAYSHHLPARGKGRPKETPPPATSWVIVS